MSVDPTGLRADLLTLFQSPPASIALCATDWADAIGAYAADVVPISTIVAAAQATLETATAAAFALPYPGSATALDAAYIAFAATVFGGMVAPAPPNAAPAGPPGWVAQLLIPQSSHGSAADVFRDLVDGWFTSTGWT
jgi:hypothetical protein